MHLQINYHQLLFDNRDILTLTRKEFELVEEANGKVVLSTYCQNFFNQETWLGNWRVEALFFWR